MAIGSRFIESGFELSFLQDGIEISNIEIMQAPKFIIGFMIAKLKTSIPFSLKLNPPYSPPASYINFIICRYKSGFPTEGGKGGRQTPLARNRHHK